MLFFKVINQLIKEYWLALGFSIAWTMFRLYNFSIVKAGYRIFTIESTENIIEVGVTSFTTALAFTTYFTSNYHRVRTNLLTDTTLQETLFQITGGNSFCYFTIYPISDDDTGYFRIISKGKYPMHDVSFRIIHWLEPVSETEINFGPSSNEKFFMLKTLLPETITFQKEQTIQLNKEAGASLECFINSKNAPIKQLYRLVFHNGSWHYALKVERKGKVLFQEISTGFPETNLDKIFSSMNLPLELS